MTVCAEPGCPELVDRGRCPAHRPPDRRPSAARRGYDRTWRKKRNPWLDGKTCAIRLPGVCTGAAQVPDHYPHSRRELLAAGARDPDDLDRWCRPACIPCHNTRTARDRR